MVSEHSGGEISYHILFPLNQATYFCASVLTFRFWVRISIRLCFYNFWLFEQLIWNRKKPIGKTTKRDKLWQAISRFFSAIPLTSLAVVPITQRAPVQNGWRHQKHPFTREVEPYWNRALLEYQFCTRPAKLSAKALHVWGRGSVNSTFWVGGRRATEKAWNT